MSGWFVRNKYPVFILIVVVNVLALAWVSGGNPSWAAVWWYALINTMFSLLWLVGVVVSVRRDRE